MPQALLPMVPAGATPINDFLNVVRRDSQWTYFLGVRPVFEHAEKDQRSFRMFTAQLICQETCQPSEIVRTFGVSANSVKRSVKKFREQGTESFYQPRRGRGATVVTPEIASEAQARLYRGESRQHIAEQLGLKPDTLRKAILQGRMSEPYRDQQVVPPPADCDGPPRDDTPPSREHQSIQTACDERTQGSRPEPPPPATDKSQRTMQDAAAAEGLGVGCTRVLDRVAASLGLLPGGAATQFEPCRDVAFDGAPQIWAGLLSRDWLEADPGLAGALYVDGHVRLYHGQLTELPRRYVSRHKLRLRGTTDYWTCDALGQPFFVVERPIDQGLLEALRQDVVPRLLKDVPGQPTQQELDANPYRHRFVLLFDREGYSPDFFREMWQTHRIACITYHKYPKESWPESEFVETIVTLPSGEVVSLKLAERGSWIGERKKGLWVREVRKLTASGHQTSLISTAYDRTAPLDDGGIFSRWSQESFFRYAMQHFGTDLLSEYVGPEKIPGTNRPVVNPARRVLDQQRRSLQSQRTQRQAHYAALTLHPESEPPELPEWERRKAALVEDVQQLEHTLEEVKQEQQKTASHLAWEELPKEAQCERLAPGRKRLLDAVRMIAHRAETAMAGILREELSRADDARSLVRDLFGRAADILPNPSSGTLRVQVHASASPRSDRAIGHLLEHLNAAEQTYPGTTLKLTYALVGLP